MKVRLFFLLIVSGLWMGCVSQPIEDRVHAPPLMISQNSDGVATIIWDSSTDYRYTLYYMDPPRGQWTVCRQADGRRGTGQQIVIKDHVRKNASELRRYRLELASVSQ